MNLNGTFLQVAAAAVLSLLLAACARNEDSSTAPIATQPAASRTRPRVLIDAAVSALGGAERLQSLRNFTLVGYGQYAYQHGGGNIAACRRTAEVPGGKRPETGL